MKDNIRHFTNTKAANQTNKSTFTRELGDWVDMSSFFFYCVCGYLFTLSDSSKIHHTSSIPQKYKEDVVVEDDNNLFKEKE